MGRKNGVRRYPTLAKVRLELSRGRKTQLDRLHRLGPGRWAEVGCFFGLWVSGAALCLWADRGLQGMERVLVLLIGCFLSAIAINGHVLMVHEAIHGLLNRKPWRNRLGAVLYGATFFMSFTAYQVQHLRHHQHLGTPLDPDEYQNYSKDPRIVFLLSCLRLVSASILYILFIPYLSYKVGSPSERRCMAREYLLMALLYAVIFLSIPIHLLTLTWLLPVFLVNFMVNLRGLTQHTSGLAQDPYLASRTVEAGPLLRFLLLGENYHFTHHIFPRVPSYHIHELHQSLRSRLPRETVCSSYFGFLLEYLSKGWKDFTPLSRRTHFKGAR